MVIKVRERDEYGTWRRIPVQSSGVVQVQLGDGSPPIKMKKLSELIHSTASANIAWRPSRPASNTGNVTLVK